MADINKIMSVYDQVSELNQSNQSMSVYDHGSTLDQTCLGEVFRHDPYLNDVLMKEIDDIISRSSQSSWYFNSMEDATKFVRWESFSNSLL